MGYKEIHVKIPLQANDEDIRKIIKRYLHLKDFTFRILQKSLDARNKRRIHWSARLGITSSALKEEEGRVQQELNIPFIRDKIDVGVVGNGPAGFFAAYVLQKAGFRVKIFERGAKVEERATKIENFERAGNFYPEANYAFGEGGAGTFSDGKLTSRSKHISKERSFILNEYVKAGAPYEILYMTHPHLGTDNLKKIVKNLRVKFMELGGEIFFNTRVDEMQVKQNTVTSLYADKGVFEMDYVLFAVGHSAYDTYRMLNSRGVGFRVKNFAIGCRVEHPQELINLAQWGRTALPGVKAAEYRLTSNADGKHPVYTFCMCPGGMIVPATATASGNIVNGMSYYQRDGYFANAACVAGVHPDVFTKKENSPMEALDFVELLENSFKQKSGGFEAPMCSILQFINKKNPDSAQTSYPLGVYPFPLWNMLPDSVSDSLVAGLKDFIKKMKGFEKGYIIGLESKTSSPVQVIREKTGLCTGFSNLFMIGEGSGYAGGIISSGADGVKTAMHLIQQHV